MAQLLQTAPAVFDVPGFCAAHGISRSFFYRLLAEGRGPRLMKLGRRTLVSAEAAAEWRERMEAMNGDSPPRGGA